VSPTEASGVTQRDANSPQSESAKAKRPGVFSLNKWQVGGTKRERATSMTRVYAEKRRASPEAPPASCYYVMYCITRTLSSRFTRLPLACPGRRPAGSLRSSDCIITYPFTATARPRSTCPPCSAIVQLKRVTPRPACYCLSNLLFKKPGS
jgi:hypothetical protein